jgi:hypothetical protein
MAENTQKPPITPESIEQQLRSINSYIDSGLPKILAGMDAAEQNQGMQIASMKSFLPQPTAPNIPKIQTLVNGDAFIGPNRGTKQGTFTSGFEYIKALSDNDKIKLSTTADPFFYAKGTSFNGSHEGYNFNRYYAHPNFKKLGFSIYKDNEATYNANSSWFDDFTRMSKTLPSLILNGAWSNLKNWGVTGLEADTETSAQMQYDLGIASSSKQGFGAFTTNLIGNFGYTIGIIGEMVLEDMALRAAAAASRNPVLMATAGVRTTSNLKNLGRAMSVMAKTLNNADKARTFSKAALSGLKSAGKTIMPFQEFGEFATDLMNPNSAISRLADGAKMARGVGSFYRGMKEINAVTSESRLEGGFTQNELIKKEYDAFIEEKGREPNDQENEFIYSNAVKGSTRTILANVPAIFVSNRITLDLALNPYGKLSRTFASNTLKSPLFKVVKGVDGKLSVEAKGLKAGFENLKGITKVFNKDFYKGTPTKLSDTFGIKNIGRNVGGGIRYFKANLMEGLQETYQEGVQVAVEDYYLNKYYADLYSDPMIAANHSIAAAIEKGFESQISSQGLDVFASGFLMGGLAGGVQNKIMQPLAFSGMRAKDYIYKTNEYKTYQEEEKQRLQNFADAVNDVRARRAEYASWLDENVKAQRDLQAEYEAWSEMGDEHEVENTKKDSMFMHVMTLLRYNRYNVFQDELEGLKDLTDDELSEAFNDQGEDKSKTRERLETAIKKANDVKKWYDKVNEKIVNPFKPNIFDRDRDPKGYGQELMGYKAFETAKQALMFNEYSYQYAIEKIESLLNKASLNSPLGNVASSDFSILYRLVDLQSRIKNDLPTEIDFLNGGDATQKKEAKKKQTQLDNLKDLNDEMKRFMGIHNLIERAASGSTEAKTQLSEIANAIKGKVAVVSEPDPITGQISMEFDSEEISDDAFVMSYQKDQLWSSYAKYSKNIADLNNVFPILESLENSFDDFTSFLKLNNDAKRFAGFLDILADPNSIYAMSDRIMGAMNKASENSANLVKEAVNKFNSITNNNELLQDLVGLKVYFAPEEVENFFKKGILPKVFYDAGTGLPIKETDPKYAKIIDFITRYEQLKGVTFSGKPVMPPAPAPGTPASGGTSEEVETASDDNLPEAEDDEEEITDETPLDKYPPKVKAELMVEYNKAVARAKKIDALIPTIGDWLADSPSAKAIIERASRRGTIVKKDITTQITKESPKSIVGPTPALAGIYDTPFKLVQGVGYQQVDDDGKPVTTAEGEPIIARRVTSIIDKIIDKSEESLKLAQDRGNILDQWLKDFSTPDPTTGISQKDYYLNLIANYNAKLPGSEADLADYVMTLIKGTELTLKIQGDKLGINFSPGTGKDLANIGMELARTFHDSVWYPDVPPVVGMIEGKLTAGTMDLLLEKDGKYYIIDFKTSFKPRRTKEFYTQSDKVQLNAYADNFESMTGLKVERLHILNLLVSSSSDGKNITSIKFDKYPKADSDKKTILSPPITRESVNSILGYKEGKADEEPVVTDAIKAIETRRQETISNIQFVEERNEYATLYGEQKERLRAKTEEELLYKIKAAYDAELVAEYRKQEIAEFRRDVEDAESFIVNGRIDSKKVKASSNAKAKEIYDRYDDLITPLLEEAKPAPAVDAAQQKTLFKVFEKAFYEGNDKRYDDISDETLAKLSPATRQYLLSLYETLKPFNSTFQRMGKILDKQTSKEITTEDQKIKYVTSSYFGGLGRGSSELGSPANPKHKDLVLPVPTADVLTNINEVFGAKLTDAELAALEGKPTTTKVDWNTVIDRAKSAQEIDKIMDQIYAANASTPELIDRALVKKESFKKSKANVPTRFGGKLIYAPYGTVDPIIFEKYDIVNADDVLKEVLRENNLSEDPNFEEKPGAVLYASPKRAILENNVKEKIKELLKSGKTVVSSNWFLRAEANVFSSPSSSKALFVKEADSAESSIDQFNEYVAKEPARQAAYDITQQEGWESITTDTKGNQVEKNTNKTIKELFEKGAINSTFVEMLVKAPNLQKLQDALAQYRIPENRSLFNKKDKEGNIVPITFEELAEIYDKRVRAFYNQNLIELMDVAQANEFIFDLRDKLASEKEGIVDNMDEETKNEIKEAVNSATDPATKIKDIQNLNDEVNNTSEEEIDNEFLDSLKECDNGKQID